MSNVAVITNLKGMRKAQQNLQRSAATTSGGAFNGKELLKLEKGTGDWVYGQEADLLEDNRIAVNPLSFQHGIIAWGEAEVLGEVMVPVTQDAPKRMEQDDPDLPWAIQLSFDAAVIDGPDKGTQLIYKTSAMGGKEFVENLYNTICDQVDEDESTPVAVVHLDNTHYRHKKWGKIFKPTFTVDSWQAIDATEAPAAEPEPEEEAPKRRRRTRASK